MKKTLISGLIAGVVLLLLSFLGLHLTMLVCPKLATEYFNPVFEGQSDRYLLYYLHPFIISLALSWFWARFKGLLSGSFISLGIEFGLIYVLIAVFPMMWLIYSSMNLSVTIVASWLAFALMQGMVAGLIFEKTNP
jgi:hypothetical protein